MAPFSDYFENCSCSILCPCLVSAAAPLTARPTEGFCNVPLIFHIENGRYGDLALDQLNVLVILHAPGVMADGDWSAATCNVDHSADDAQTEALAAIFSGAAGGPMAAFTPLIAKNLGVRKVPITFRIDGKTRSAEIPDILHMSVDPLPTMHPSGEMWVNIGHPVPPTRWRWPSAQQAIFSAIMACAGIIPARTASMRRSVGRTRRDAAPDAALQQDRQRPSQMTDSHLETLLRRDRWVVGGAIGIIVALAWGYVIWLANDMDMGGMDMTEFRMIRPGSGSCCRLNEPWRAIEFAFVFAMWAVMMIGMMTPSAAPMILMYARVGRQGRAQGKPFAATGWFAAGYLLAWSGFSLAATFLQWAIERAALLDSRMAIDSNLTGAIVLIAAGIYQWTPLKDVCLAHCQSPLFVPDAARRLSRRPARLPAARASARQLCVRCCWALMALLFVGGVMNVLWIALLTLLVLLEKLTPVGRWIARAAGIACVAEGAWLLVSLPR